MSLFPSAATKTGVSTFYGPVSENVSNISGGLDEDYWDLKALYDVAVVY